MITVGQLFVFMFIEMLMCCVCFALGAYSVYRTKREPHETFIGGPPKGEVFSLDTDHEADIEPAKAPDSIMDRINAFYRQFDASNAE